MTERNIILLSYNMDQFNLLDFDNDVLNIIGDKVIDDIIIMMVFKHWKNARNTQTH